MKPSLGGISVLQSLLYATKIISYISVLSTTLSGHFLSVSEYPAKIEDTKTKVILQQICQLINYYRSSHIKENVSLSKGSE